MVPIGLGLPFMLLNVDLPLGKPPRMLVFGWNAFGSTALYTVTPSMPPPFCPLGVRPCAASFFHCCFSRKFPLSRDSNTK